MKQILFNSLNNEEVFSVLIKWKNNLYYTGYYYDEDGNDYLFNDLENIKCFKTFDELVSFCGQNNLLLNKDVSKYDFDIMLTNPIDYSDALNKWNILNTISLNLNIVFEGNENKYTEVYKYLFSCNFAIEQLPPLYKIPNKYFKLIISVFNNQNEVLDKLLYSNDNI